MPGTKSEQDYPDYAGMTEAQIAADVRRRRDARLAPVLKEHLPAWIIWERVKADAQTCTFDVVFCPGLQWQRRRYTYDAQVDVLHYRGAEPFDANELSELPQEALYQLPV